MGRDERLCYHVHRPAATAFPSAGSRGFHGAVHCSGVGCSVHCTMVLGCMLVYRSHPCLAPNATTGHDQPGSTAETY